MPQGKLYGVGVGSGDPELLTLKAKRILEEVDILFVPKSNLAKRSLALSIVADISDKNWQVIDLHLPMIRERKDLKRHWREAAEIILQALEKGQDGAFITLGDPGLYSTFSYLARNIQEIDPDVVMEIIPGVSAVNSISAWLKEPLAEGEEKLIIMPALGEKEQIAPFIDSFDNVVLLKAGKNINKIIEIVEDRSDLDKVIFATRCGFEDGFYTTDLKAVSSREWDYLSTVLVKKKRKEDA
ncbi:cobalt-precorrin-2 c20-methyltransferase [hydrocarbon metagenome]|uniref:Cobalt-precorrin-2 c20-methyltransferase n=1 Tax=hydrocarbon metagenome TaxID=938273 RepID=A0A0W8EA20_9ZZZZ